MTMIVLNPEGEVRARAAQLAARLEDPSNAVIGIVDDGLVGSDYFMKAIESLLQTEYGAKTRYWLKPMLSRPAPPDLIEQVAAECDAVVVGIAG
ncbi:MAG: hypothetical protein HY329_09370 [Chloroflexi bacterium]|nr:hypothetical protein [Chloroflexota bacterium]